jgi:hypothetical protein
MQAPPWLSVRVVIRDGRIGAPLKDGRLLLFGIFPSRWKEDSQPDGSWLLHLPEALLSDERMMVSCAAPGYLRVERPLRELASKAVEGGEGPALSIDLAPAPGDVALVRVVDHETGLPLEGAEAMANPPRRRETLPPVVRSDASGAMSIPTSYSGRRVLVKRDGFLPCRLSVPTEPADLGEIRMRKDRFLAALMVQVDGAGMEGKWGGWIRIERTGPPLDSPEFLSLVSLPGEAFRGAYEQGLWAPGGMGPGVCETSSPTWEGKGLLPGHYKVLAFAPRRGFSAREITLLGKDVELRLPLGEGTRVDVRRGPWSEDVAVALVPESPTNGIQTTHGDAFAHVLPGRYAVELRFPGAKLRVREVLEVPEEGALLLDLADLRLVRTRVRGRLVVERPGGAPSPVPGARVRIVGGESSLALETASDGTFLIPDARPGEYRLGWVEGYAFEHLARRAFDVPMDAGGSLDVGDFPVRPRGPGPGD